MVNKALPSNSFLVNGMLQRKCACGQHKSSAGECAQCDKKKLNKSLQTKLQVSESNDKYEQEADRVAEQVMQMPISKNSNATEYIQTTRSMGSDSIDIETNGINN